MLSEFGGVLQVENAPVQWAANNYARGGNVTRWKLLLLTDAVHEAKMPLIGLLSQRQCTKEIVMYFIKERKPVCFVVGDKILIYITWGLKQYCSSKIIISIANSPLFRK